MKLLINWEDRMATSWSVNSHCRSIKLRSGNTVDPCGRIRALKAVGDSPNPRHAAMQLFVVHLKTGAGLWEKGGSREKAPRIIPSWGCVVSVTFLLGCGSQACDKVLLVLCANLLAEL